MKREAFVLPLSMIFLLFALIVSVFLMANSTEILKASKELDKEALEKYEKLGYVSVMNTWNTYLINNKTWDNHHQVNDRGDVSTITTLVFPAGFFEVNLNTKDYSFTINSSSAYYEDNEFTLEMSSTKTGADTLPSDYVLVEDNLMVTFAQNPEN